MPQTVACPPNEADVRGLPETYTAVRKQTESLCEPLEIDDYQVQSMPDASPVKWHLAHTSWFFEAFVLSRYLPGYRPYHPEYGFLFNSYYNAIGARWPRQERGLLSRPTVAEISRYRAHVDEQMEHLFSREDLDGRARMAATVVLGINHEQQHQELILTDLKHAWGANPLHPIYRPALPEQGEKPARAWVGFPEGEVWIGHEGEGFAYDNECPHHRTFVHAFRLSNQLVTNAEYLSFIRDGGYNRPELWLSDGWTLRQARGWNAPLYWAEEERAWYETTLSGRRPLVSAAPVCHVSYYEADAFARWAGRRLPREAEWEVAAGKPTGHFLDSGRFHPSSVPAANDAGPIYQLYGDVWQWTASPYVAYPGYRPAPGALGEYNGKFMCNQFVLRGASCATPRDHARQTYRNFFPPDARWQFTGIRLARDV